MSGLGFTFHGVEFEARASGALWWPRARWLIVADLHLGKSERMARRGGALLPPYDSHATLERLGAEITALAPRRIISLGDGFDDLAAAEALPDKMIARIAALAQGRSWVWVTGNHDPDALPEHLPGQMATEVQLEGVTLRHQADATGGPDISGHFHPVVRLAKERRRAFLIGRNHLILPAFGAYTGGLSCEEAPLRDLVGQGIAVACVGARALPVPIGTKY